VNATYTQSTAHKREYAVSVGRQFGIVIYLWGDFASVSATAATHSPTATLKDSERKPTSKTVAVTVFDQGAFTGILKSGVVSSIIWCGSMKSTPSRKQFV